MTILLVLAIAYGVTVLLAFGACWTFATYEGRSTFDKAVKCAGIALVWPVIALLLARK